MRVHVGEIDVSLASTSRFVVERMRMMYAGQRVLMHGKIAAAMN